MVSNTGSSSSSAMSLSLPTVITISYKKNQSILCSQECWQLLNLAVLTEIAFYGLKFDSTPLFDNNT